MRTARIILAFAPFLLFTISVCLVCGCTATTAERRAARPEATADLPAAPLQPVLSKGAFCASVEQECCFFGDTQYRVVLRNAAGETVGGCERVGSPPAFLFNGLGHLVCDLWAQPRWPDPPSEAAAESLDPVPPADNPAEVAAPDGAGAVALCAQMVPRCADRWKVEAVSCARRGCAFRLGASPASCFVWRASGAERPELLAAFQGPLGYTGPEIEVGDEEIDLVGAHDIHHGFLQRILLGDKLRRPAVDGEVPMIEGKPSESALGRLRSMGAFVQAVSLQDVLHGGFAWGGPADASLRWQLALDSTRLSLFVQILDDAPTTMTCDPASPVRCDHLEILAGPTPEAGIMLAVVLREGGRADVEQWRRAGQEIREARAGDTCTWRKGAEIPDPRGSASPPMPIVEVECLLARSLLWKAGEEQTLEIRYSDSDTGLEQKSLIGQRRVYRALADFPPPYAPTFDADPD